MAQIQINIYDDDNASSSASGKVIDPEVIAAAWAALDAIADITTGPTPEKANP